MEVAAAGDDDSEPAKETNTVRLPPVDEAELVEKFENLSTTLMKGQFDMAVCDEKRYDVVQFEEIMNT